MEIRSNICMNALLEQEMMEQEQVEEYKNIITREMAWDAGFPELEGYEY